MMMDAVILVRHGLSTVNVQKLISSDYEGYPLTDGGRAQVEWISSQLSGARIDGVISSPLLRTRQTADIISQKLGLEFSVDERIRESGLGPYNNFMITDIAHRRHEDLGMESWESHVERTISLVEEMKGTQILVSHAFPIRAVVSYYLGLGETESQGIEVKNATASVIDVKEGTVLCVGSYSLSERVLSFLGKI